MQTGFIKALGPIVQTANSYIQIASGPAAARPSTANAAMIRFNTDVNRFEGFNGTLWANVGFGDGSVSNVVLTSNTTGITVTGGPITSTGSFVLNLGGELSGLNALNTLGLVQRTASGTYSTLSTLPITNGGTGATTANAALTNLNGLSLYGGTMQGALLLSGDPTMTLQAATKSYVDNAISNNAGANLAGPGLTYSATYHNLTVNTSQNTTGIVNGGSANVVVRSTALLGQTLLSTGQAGAEATWGALNLASANAVTGALPITNGGTGGTTAAAARSNLGVAGIYRQSFTSANVTANNTVLITHNLGQQFVNPVITDNTNAVIEPDNIFMTNATTMTIDVTSFVNSGGFTGTWNVVVAG